jgi:peptidoglycan/xylan/chitin deacetylase (PgdA/CDA1 family)
LTYIPAADAEREIRCSWELLKARLPEAVATFSYPNGYFNDDHVHAVQAAGYRLAFTTSRGFVTSATDPFRIPRLNVHEGATSTVPMFLARAVGLM